MTWHDIVVMAKSCQILSHLPDVEGMCKKAYDTILHSQMLSSKDTNYRPFKEGEKVWLDAKNLHTTHPTHKLRAKRYGPFQIVKKLSDVTYQINLPLSWKIHNVFHTSYLSKYNETLEHGPNYLKPPPELIEGEEEWEIEAILNEKYDKRKKKQMYQIHWKGYLSVHDTWEPEDNVHAPELLQKWKKDK